ncbi:hypothetical protein [Candidatus Formimonas warabiya]|uniref:Copper amine oxidase-like N-terminal domain-containing protein n=1 Tax=Formimonas warabiya TaxID=1761012 RepID=A0A3G1KMV7_FORW1|nr:hypothetical protein [Candidatus Formimonas warabiya]ATW23750.1 hypothetical protein DCMF_02125 [Candidatus Formimonas warabiya]
MFFKKMLLILFMVMLFPAASFAADWNDYWVSGWHDDNSGYDIYNLSPANEKVKDRTVIMHNLGQNEWVRLEEGVQSLWQPYDGKLPGAWVMEKGKEFNPYENYNYDIKNNRLILGEQYHISPDEKWGIQQNDYYELVKLGNIFIYNHGSIEAAPSKTKSYLLKNLENGTIEEWLKTENSTWYYWLPDSTVLLCTYSQNEKQNVISIFDPKTKKFEKVVSGSLYAYDREKNRILFVKNEPMRKTWVMDLSTRIEKREINTASFYPSPVTLPKVPLPPKDLNIDSLKVVTPERVTRYEHEIRMGDQIIPVPYIFERENKEFIPLRPLIETLGIKVNIKQLGSYVKEYQVSYQGNKFTLLEEEFINYKWKLFVTTDVLKKMGLPEFTINQFKN